MVYQRNKSTERKRCTMMAGEERYRRIHTVFTAAAALFFFAGAITEFYLKKTYMHVSD